MASRPHAPRAERTGRDVVWRAPPGLRARVVFGASMAFGLLASPGLGATADLFDRVPTFMLLRPRYGDGEVIARHILDLRDRSPAFRGLLDVLETHSDLRVLVAPMD